MEVKNPTMIRTWYNPPHDPGEVNDQPSDTIPDQTLPLKTLLLRCVNGQEVFTEPAPEHFSTEYPGIENLSRVERAHLLLKTRRETTFIQRELQKRKKEQEAEKATEAGAPAASGSSPSDPSPEAPGESPDD